MAKCPNQIPLGRENMTRMNIDIEEFFADGRFDGLAQLCGETRFAIESRILRVWAKCYTLRVAVLDEETINQQAVWFGEKSFAQLMVRVGLADRQGELFRVRGVWDRIQYLKSFSERGKKGAEKRWSGSIPKEPGADSQAIAKPSHSHSPAKAEMADPSLRMASSSSSVSKEENQNPLNVGGVVHTARPRVDPPTHPPTFKKAGFSPPMTVAKLVEGGALDFNPDTKVWHRVAAEFAASAFLGGLKPGSDGELFSCADPVAWAIKRADEIAEGKYRDRPIVRKKRAAGFAHVPNGKVADGPTGFEEEPPEPGGSAVVS